MDSDKKVIVQQKQGKLLETLIADGYEGSFCNGRGTCKRCKVKIVKYPPLPTLSDRNAFTPEELRQGYRLACGVKVKEGMELEVCFPSTPTLAIVADHNSWNESEEKKETVIEEYFVAIDIGTTTIAMQRVGIQSGNVYQTYRSLNPQRVFGTDVLARMQNSINGKKEQLQQVIQKELEKGIRELQAGSEQMVTHCVIAANTTMIHLLMGYEVKGMASHPFQPVNISEISTTIAGIPATIFPGISAFVGGDVVAGWVACGLHKETNLHFLIDLGTNGEMMIGNKERIICTSTAAGPAFEGGPTANVPGADMISLIAKLRRAGIVDETGLLSDAYFDHGYDLDGVHITQKDIRDLQKAKAAIYAGMNILIQKYEATWEQIDRIYLAGGFGYFLSVEDADCIGLFPHGIKDKVTAVGNSSLAGAILYGRSERETLDLKKVTEVAEEMNLARELNFETAYLEALNFPEIL